MASLWLATPEDWRTLFYGLPSGAQKPHRWFNDYGEAERFVSAAQARWGRTWALVELKIGAVVHLDPPGGPALPGAKAGEVDLWWRCGHIAGSVRCPMCRRREAIAHLGYAGHDRAFCHVCRTEWSPGERLRHLPAPGWFWDLRLRAVAVLRGVGAAARRAWNRKP